MKLLDLQYPAVKRDGRIGVCFYLIDISFIQQIYFTIQQIYGFF
jgi:hypothetical protein